MDTALSATAAASDAGPRRRARVIAVAVAVGAALVLWAVVEVVFGHDLHGPVLDPAAEPIDVGPGLVLVGSLGASLAGWALLAVLERFASRARLLWLVVAVIVLVASLGGPLGGTGAEASDRAALVALHLVVGGVLIPLLYRTSST